MSRGFSTLMKFTSLGMPGLSSLMRSFEIGSVGELVPFPLFSPPPPPQQLLNQLFICRYLVDQKNVEQAEALSKFLHLVSSFLFGVLIDHCFSVLKSMSM